MEDITFRALNILKESDIVLCEDTRRSLKLFSYFKIKQNKLSPGMHIPIHDYEYFQNKYGEWILYDPKLNKNTYILWLLPLLIFLIGGAIIIKSFIIKK